MYVYVCLLDMYVYVYGYICKYICICMCLCICLRVPSSFWCHRREFGAVYFCVQDWSEVAGGVRCITLTNETQWTYFNWQKFCFGRRNCFSMVAEWWCLLQWLNFSFLHASTFNFKVHIHKHIFHLIA